MQEPILTLHAAHDIETYAAFHEAANGRKMWLSFAVFATATVLSLVAALVFNETMAWLSTIIFLIGAVFFLYYPLAKPHLRKLEKQLKEKPTSETFAFYLDEIKYEGQGENVRRPAAIYQYNRYVSAWEFPAFFTLNHSATSIVLFAKKDMTEEQQQAFRAVLTEKYGEKFTQRKHVPSQIK